MPAMEVTMVFLGNGLVWAAGLALLLAVPLRGAVANAGGDRKSVV